MLGGGCSWLLLLWFLLLLLMLCALLHVCVSVWVVGVCRYASCYMFDCLRVRLWPTVCARSVGGWRVVTRVGL